MSGNMNISAQGFKDAWEQLKEGTANLVQRITEYFSSLELYQLIAWAAIGVGLVLVIISIVLFSQ